MNVHEYAVVQNEFLLKMISNCSLICSFLCLTITTINLEQTRIQENNRHSLKTTTYTERTGGNKKMNETTPHLMNSLTCFLDIVRSFKSSHDKGIKIRELLKKETR